MASMHLGARADLLLMQNDSARETMMSYVSVLFAFLVAAYFAAPHLNRAMTVISIGLFSVFSAIMLFVVNRTLATSFGLAENIRQNATGGDTTLAWHPITSEQINFFAPATPVITGTLVLGMLSCIVFFFLARKRDPNLLR